MDRKQFFKELACRVGIGIEGAIGRVAEAIDSEIEDQRSKRVRPPGAHPQETHFLSLCTGCDACMAACPVGAIMIEDLERRDPLLYSEVNPCIECPGTPCITACSSGALARQFGINRRGF